MASPAQAIANGAKRTVYGARQAARVLWYTGHYAAGRHVMGPLTNPGEPPYAEEFGPVDRARLKDSFSDLFKTDWKNIEEGRYKLPKGALRAPSPARLWKQSRDYLRDAAKVAQRKSEGGHSEVLTPELREKFPRYYLQNFHYQTGGWLTAGSADRYDMQVETLFTGSADAMRRHALPAIGEIVGAHQGQGRTLLDVGCGTGGFLREVKHNWPDLRVTALDLSPAYLAKAQSKLGQWSDVEYRQDNAEKTELEDGLFDVVTAVYLFHELPPAARANVAREISRLLKPGGRFVLVDTLQYGDEPGFDILLENFPRGFHEPYYDSYCREDLGDLFGKHGLTEGASTLAFLSKISIFEKAL